jgi:hypothetical protein
LVPLNPELFGKKHEARNQSGRDCSANDDSKLSEFSGVRPWADAAFLSGLRSSMALHYVCSRSFEPLADIFAIKKNVRAFALNLLHLPNVNKCLEEKEPSVHKSIDEAAFDQHNPALYE